MKGVNVLISFLDLLYIMLILAYGKATDFYKLVLYPDLLKVFISFKSFQTESIGAFMYQVMWSARKDNWTFPLFVAILFLLSYYSLVRF